MNDAQIAERVEEIAKTVNNLTIGDHVAVMIEKDENLTRLAAELCMKFGQNNVQYGGEPALFPNTVRVLIYRQ